MNILNNITSRISPYWQYFSRPKTLKIADYSCLVLSESSKFAGSKSLAAHFGAGRYFAWWMQSSQFFKENGQSFIDRRKYLPLSVQSSKLAADTFLHCQIAVWAPLTLTNQYTI